MKPAKVLRQRQQFYKYIFRGAIFFKVQIIWPISDFSLRLVFIKMCVDPVYILIGPPSYPAVVVA